MLADREKTQVAGREEVTSPNTPDLYVSSDNDTDASFVGMCLDGRYDIVKRIASGGMGDVYLAHQRGVGQDVAVKKLRDEVYSNPTAVKHFIEEARAYARVTHPNAVRLYDLLRVNRQICIILEYVPGQTLSSLIDDGYIFTIRQITEIALQLADALGTIHQAGIFHRDIKSQNIMLLETVGGRFSVKVLDFGIAGTLGANTSSLEDGCVLGSPMYMSPEQCKGEPLDARTDIYSFGVVLYEMVCGKVPFTGNTANAIMKQHVSAPVPLMQRQDGSEIPSGLNAIIRKCLEKDFNLRYSAFAEVIMDLTCLQEGRSLCIAESQNVRLDEIMASIAAAERELSRNTTVGVRHFALDAGETVITKTSADLTHSSWIKIKDFCQANSKHILISLCAFLMVMITITILFTFIMPRIGHEKDIALYPAPVNTAPTIDFSDDDYDFCMLETIKNDLSDKLLDVSQKISDQHDIFFFNGAQRACSDGFPESGFLWLSYVSPDADIPSDLRHNLTQQCTRYNEFIHEADRFLNAGDCQGIPSLLTRAEAESSKLAAQIRKKFEKCQQNVTVNKPEATKTPAKTQTKPAARKPQKNTKKSKASSGFDWSSIQTK